MNFLAHHAVALSRVARGAERAMPKFFVGNVLPDLISISGVPRVRPSSLTQRLTPLARGMALHLESDRRFHAHPAFVELQSIVKALLLAAPFAEPPARVFFLAHVFVEIALDSYLLRETPVIARDLYCRFDACDRKEVVSEIQAILLVDEPLQALVDVIDRFVRYRYLFEYASSEGCAESLHQICRRAGVVGFPAREDRDTLTGIFDSFALTIPSYADALLGCEPYCRSMVQ